MKFFCWLYFSFHCWLGFGKWILRLFLWFRQYISMAIAYACVCGALSKYMKHEYEKIKSTKKISKRMIFHIVDCMYMQTQIHSKLNRTSTHIEYHRHASPVTLILIRHNTPKYKKKQQQQQQNEQTKNKTRQQHIKFIIFFSPLQYSTCWLLLLSLDGATHRAITSEHKK